MADDAAFSEHRSIVLPRGGTLEVDMTEAFKDQVRKSFNLRDDEYVSDDHVRMFFYGAMDNAIGKAVNDGG